MEVEVEVEHSILKLCDRSLNETGDASMANAELLDVIRLEHTVRT